MPDTSDADTLREQLALKHGREYWRSLDELSRSAQFGELLHREFPREASVLDAIGRRDFLTFMGASLALAGLAGCGSEAPRHIVPYAAQPEQMVQGKPLFFTSATDFNGYAIGTVVTSNMGRPTKVEGNPGHPASLGATDVFAQASVWSLYDPDRSQTVLERGELSSWSRFTEVFDAALALEAGRAGAGLRVLTESVTSPTLQRLLNRMLQQYPQAKAHQWQPVNRDSERLAALSVFGDDVNTLCHFDRADVIVSLDSDFLCESAAKLRYAREFTAKRRVRGETKSMSRLYVFECTPSITGSMADHRFPIQSAQISPLARLLAAKLGVQTSGAANTSSAAALGISDSSITAIINDLQQHRGTSLIVAGPHQPPEVHALAHAMNAALENAGHTVTYTEPVEERPIDQLQSLRELTDDLNAGKVGTLLVLGGDPVYTAPTDLNFEAAYQKAATRIHLGQYQNATAYLSHWHIPQTHELEGWFDLRAFDGTVSIQQPLILPLYNGRSSLELAARLGGDLAKTSYELVRDTWMPELSKTGDVEIAWRTALSDGLIKDTARPAKTVAIKGPVVSPPTKPAADAGGIELNLRPDPSIWDGRYVNNGWLQECPKPLNKLTWDNAVLIAPDTAARLGVAAEDVVEVTCDGRSIRGSVFVMPGHAANSVTLHLGYGQEHTGRVGKGAGFNAYALRSSRAMSFAPGATIARTGAKTALATTQIHFNMEGRNLIQEGTLAAFIKDPGFLRKAEERPLRESLYKDFQYSGYAWGMVIDINACIGCNACVVACQSENNIPVVGKEQVIRGREMHWLRVDHYYSGASANPESSFQPVPCMQCENAPCEQVCPVAATSHSAEGLNDMVYNRCIGTRYCSNNCPYKVRRFNFLQYTELEEPHARLLANPDVTVRERGVMEKCTYCVQRITRGRIDSEKENRPVRDGEVRPACAQACPAEAIVFGDLNNKESGVAKLKSEPLNYALLEELNTRPRTTYLARIRNPNPDITGAT